MNNNEFQRTENLPFEIDESKARRKPKSKKKKTSPAEIVARVIISVALSALLVHTR